MKPKTVQPSRFFLVGIIAGIIAPAILLGTLMAVNGIQTPPPHSHVDLAGAFYALLWFAGAVVGVLGFAIWQSFHAQRGRDALRGGVGYGLGCVLNVVGLAAIQSGLPKGGIGDPLAMISLGAAIVMVLSAIVCYAAFASRGKKSE